MPERLVFLLAATHYGISTVNSFKLPPTGLRFEKIDKRYGGLYALRRVSFEITPGECVVLAGRNGSGKTTLLRVASQIVRPTAGKLTFPGAEDANARNGRPGYVAHTTMVYDELTAEENLVFFARLQNVEQPVARAEELLHEVGLIRTPQLLPFAPFPAACANASPSLAPLSIAPLSCSLTSLPLDSTRLGIAWLANSLRELNRAGCTIVMSLHGESEISALATRAVRLDAGAVVDDTNSGASLRSILNFGGA